MGNKLLFTPLPRSGGHFAEYWQLPVADHPDPPVYQTISRRRCFIQRVTMVIYGSRLHAGLTNQTAVLGTLFSRQTHEILEKG